MHDDHRPTHMTYKWLAYGLRCIEWVRQWSDSLRNYTVREDGISIFGLQNPPDFGRSDLPRSGVCISSSRAARSDAERADGRAFLQRF